jgi:hypothetical protein
MADGWKMVDLGQDTGIYSIGSAKWLVSPAAEAGRDVAAAIGAGSLVRAGVASAS